MIFRLSLIFTIIMSVCSCRLNDVMDDTQEMKNITERMHKGTEDLIFLNRSKESQETRERTFKSMEETTSFKKKLELAAVYFKSFEFQLWRPEDNFHVREKFLESAAHEFFLSFESLLDVVDKDDLSPSSDDRYNLALYAAAVNLHQMHPFQELLVEEHGSIGSIHLLSAIKSGLSKLDELEKGELTSGELKSYEAKVLEFEQSARLALKLRFNMLVTMTLAKVSNISEAGIFKKAKMMLFDWDSKFIDLNTIEQGKANDYLNEAITTRAFLRSIGDDVKLDKKVKKIVSNMQVPSSCENCIKSEEQNLNLFNNLIKKVLTK